MIYDPHREFKMVCNKRRTDREFIALVAPKAWELGSNLAKLFVGLALPGMVEKAIQYGREEKNFRDRQLSLQSGGVAPTPHGATINVNQNNAQWNSGHSTLPDFSRDTIELVAAIRD